MMLMVTMFIFWLIQKAQSELAYELQASITKQKIKEEEMQIKVVERAQQINVQEQVNTCDFDFAPSESSCEPPSPPLPPLLWTIGHNFPCMLTEMILKWKGQWWSQMPPLGVSITTNIYSRPYNLSVHDDLLRDHLIHNVWKFLKKLWCCVGGGNLLWRRANANAVTLETSAL